jgi:hypothetical protein
MARKRFSAEQIAPLKGLPHTPAMPVVVDLELLLLQERPSAALSDLGLVALFADPGVKEFCRIAPIHVDNLATVPAAVACGDVPERFRSSFLERHIRAPAVAAEQVVAKNRSERMSTLPAEQGNCEDHCRQQAVCECGLHS